jgi:hypothetical protein
MNAAGPAGEDRESRYGPGIAALSFVSLIAVLAIVWGELTGHRLVAGGAVGVILLAYSFILLFLRKGGFTGV